MSMFSGKKQKNSTSVEQSAIKTIFGSGIHITGKLNGDEAIKIDGKVDGDININNNIIIGEQAVINGDIASESIVIFGTVNGNITTKNCFLKSTAHINGDLSVEVIEIEVGGQYNGQLKMKPAHNNTPPPTKKKEQG